MSHDPKANPLDLPPADEDRLSQAVRRVLTKRKPPGGWPGKPPKEVREDEKGDGA